MPLRSSKQGGKESPKVVSYLASCTCSAGRREEALQAMARRSEAALCNLEIGYARKTTLRGRRLHVFIFLGLLN
ncbi:hypothetical protein GBA52_020899 [Prunus armeniaca]|nr:hypothetical protein GBA52_020899 [Prunus armeniaca]